MRDIDQALQRLNPVQDGASADTKKLKNILATPRPVVSATRPRSLRQWSIATVAVAAAAAVVYTVVDPFGTSAQPALAVTPQPLAYHSGSPSAAQVLKDTASRVEGLRMIARQPGRQSILFGTHGHSRRVLTVRTSPQLSSLSTGRHGRSVTARQTGRSAPSPRCSRTSLSVKHGRRPAQSEPSRWCPKTPAGQLLGRQPPNRRLRRQG